MVSAQLKVSRIFLGGGGVGGGINNTLKWHCCKVHKKQSPRNRSAAFLNLSE